MGVRVMPVVVAALAACVTAAAGASAPPSSESAPWMNLEWPVRRIVDVKVEGGRPLGNEVAVAAFYTGGLAKPDASDVRVTTGARAFVNHRILQVGPGDFVRLAFEAAPNESRYYIYYGNPKAEAPKPWEPPRGVLLEVRRWPGDPAPDRFARLQAAWNKAKPLGADFVSHVSFGFNPFAESETPAVAHYTGWFVVDTPGTYQVELSTNGASWLFIDGKEANSWPGPHGPAAHSRRAKPFVLTEGAHRLDCWNANDSGSMMTVALWQPPKGGAFEAIPPKVFLPVVQAALLGSDMVKEKLVADFFPEHAGETWWPDQYAIRMRFRNLTRGLAAQAVGRSEWDFGDGQTSTLSGPVHVYLAPGDYTVTLKQTLAAATSTFRTRVRVERNWWKQTDPAIDPVARYADDAARYDFAGLDVRGLTAAVSLFHHEDRKEALAAAAAELALKRPQVDEAEVHRVGQLLGETLRAVGKPQEAIAAYRLLEQRCKAPYLKAQLAVQIAEALLRDLRRWDDAEKQYQRVLKTYETGGAQLVLRRANIGMGDIWRHRGDGDKARRAYGAAAAVRLSAAPPNEAAVRVGTLARYVEEYTREKQWEWAFKYLDDWAWEFPRDKLEGNWSLLKASALAAKGDRDDALLEACDLVAGNPASAYAVRLLMLAAECCVAMGDPDKARLLLQSAVEDYPEDPEQGAAKKRLAALGGPLKTDVNPVRRGALAPEPRTEPGPPSGPAPRPEPQPSPPPPPPKKP
jgi:tetratricopeptide (TPR) repeat protein